MKNLDTLQPVRRARATVSSFACPNCACPCKYCQVACSSSSTRAAEIIVADDSRNYVSNTAAGKQAQMIG